MRIGIVTCRVLPEPDPDQQPLLDALSSAGMDAELAAWDAVDASGLDAFDRCVLRSCWNYYEDADAFRAWIDEASRRTVLLNPAGVVHANLHKRYLEDLEARGVPIIPTAWVAHGHRASLRNIASDWGWTDLVIKPCISAASFRTKRFRQKAFDEGQAFLDALAADGDVMIQCYMEEVDRSGERAIVWIDGEVTHAIRKNPRFAGEEESVSDALPVSEQERDLAIAVIGESASDLLYARVDVVRDGSGELCLSELELIEPSLFLIQHPEALTRLVAGIRRRAERA